MSFVEFPLTPMKPPFKGQQGQWLTSGLFYEHWVQISSDVRIPRPFFSLDKNIPGLVNAKDTFLAIKDPTGFKWAKQYLGSYDHFLVLLRSSWFKDAYDNWLAELKIELKSDAVERIQDIAKGKIDGTPAAVVLQANKYLAGADWEKALSARGRPSQAELKGELKRQAEFISDVNNDAQRIGLKLIDGGKK